MTKEAIAFTSGAKRSVLSPRQFIDIAVATIRKLEREGEKGYPTPSFDLSRSSFSSTLATCLFLVAPSSLGISILVDVDASGESIIVQNQKIFEENSFLLSSKDPSFGLFLKLKISNRLIRGGGWKVS